MKIIPKLPVEYTRELSLRSVYVLQLEPQHVSIVLNHLSKCYPLPKSMSHLKRIRKVNQDSLSTTTSGIENAVELQIILGYKEDFDSNSINSVLCRMTGQHKNMSLNMFEIHFTRKEAPLSSVDMCKGDTDDMGVQKMGCLLPKSARISVTIADVPEYPAYTKEQFEKWKHLWPMSFHVYRDIHDFDIVAENELEYVKRQVEKVCKESKVKGCQVCLISILLPSSTTLPDSRKELKSESKLQGMNSMDVLERIPRTLGLGYHDDKTHPLKHASFQAIQNVSKQEQLKRHELMKHKTSKRLSENDDIVYLLTGCDVFVSYEPCVMCTMALLHSRIKRLFYISETVNHEDNGNSKEESRISRKEKSNDVGYGGGISLYQMHTKKELNHKFDVYEIQL